MSRLARRRDVQEPEILAIGEEDEEEAHLRYPEVADIKPVSVSIEKMPEKLVKSIRERGFVRFMACEEEVLLGKEELMDMADGEIEELREYLQSHEDGEVEEVKDTPQSPSPDDDEMEELNENMPSPSHQQVRWSDSGDEWSSGSEPVKKRRYRRRKPREMSVEQLLLRCCIFCDKKYQKNEGLEKHLQKDCICNSTAENQEKSMNEYVTCRWPGCREMVMCGQEAKNHVKRHQQEAGLVACEYCEQFCMNQRTLERHFKAKHKLVKCRSCPKVLQGNEALARHDKSCHNTLCICCKVIFPSIDDLASHCCPRWITPCKTCGLMFKNRRLHHRHTQVHRDKSNDKPALLTTVICEKCGKRMQRKSLLLHDCDKKKKLKGYSKTSGGFSSCQICGRMYRSAGSLYYHLKTHEKKKFECKICNKAFINKQVLAHHINSHLGEKPFQCRFCDQRFGQLNSRINHERLHTKEKPYKCEICPASFTQKTSLVQHRRTHSGEKPYECDLCAAKFSQPGSLKLHRNTHLSAGEKPYRCERCGCGFNQRVGLVAHLNKCKEEGEEGK